MLPQVRPRHALTNQLNWKADQDLSLLVLQRVNSALQRFPQESPPYPVVLVGLLRPPESPLHFRRDVIGSSFYYENGGSTSRMVSLWRSMRHFDFRQATDGEALAVAEQNVMTTDPAYMGCLPLELLSLIASRMRAGSSTICGSTTRVSWPKKRCSSSASSTTLSARPGN